MASPRLQCTSLWTSKRKRVKRYEFGRARFANRRAAIDSDVLFSPFFFLRVRRRQTKTAKKEERAHRGPKRTVERTNGDNSSFPRIAIKSTTRLSVSFFSFIFHDNRVARRSRTTTVTERTEARDEIETEETANSRPLQRDGTERQRHLVVTKKANTRDLTRRRHLRDNRRLGTRRCRRRQRRVRGKNKRGNNEEKVVIDSKAARLQVPLLVVAALQHRLLWLLPLRPPHRSERWRIS